MQAQGSRCTSVISSLQRFNVTSASRWRSSSTLVPFATWKELKPSAVGHAPCGGLSPRFQRVGLCEVSPVDSRDVCCAGWLWLTGPPLGIGWPSGWM